MPRVTRKALAEGPTDPPTRSSARASTKASTTSSRTSRSTTAASPSPARGSRSRRSKSPVKEDEEEEEEEVVETKRTGRGRQAGDAAEEDVKPAGRSRSNAKKGAKAEEPKVEPKKGGRSRSKAGKKEEPKEEEQEEEEQEEEAAAETTSRGRSRAKKSEAKPAAEGRSSRSMSKDSSVAESETAETGRGRSRGKKAPAESPANSRSSSRRGAAKSEEPAEEAPETSQPRGRSRGKAAKPEPEAEPAGRNRRGKKAQSPSESVGSSRSSSRSRASKAQSEDAPEPEVKSRGRRGAAKTEEKAEEASTPTGRGGRRGRKSESSPAPPAAKRRRGGKKDSPSVADELEPSEDQPVVQLKKIDDQVKDEEKKRKAESKDESQEEEMQVDESKDSAEKKSEDTVDTIPEPDQPEDKEAEVETPAKEEEPEVEKTDKPAEPEVPAKSTPAKEDETPVTKETKTEEAKSVEKSPVAQQVRIEVQPPSPVKEPEENGQKMELDGFDNKPLGQGKKRKLEDEEVEESETKRACVETNSAEVKDVPMEETRAPIQPAFEAVSDVSSAEEDVPAPPLNNYTSSAPAAVEPSKPDSQNNVVEMIGAKSEEATIDSQSSQKASAEIPTKEANGSADDDYVIVNMEDVPSADSNLIKDSLPVHQNHSKQQNQEQQSMETDQSKPTQEQKTIATSPVVPVIPNTEAPKTEISAPKPVRIFEPSPDIFHRTCVRNPSVGESVEPSATFSVVSYNILAECHRLRGDYSYTEEKFLSQNYRHDLLMKELKYLDADVVCLQEVDPDYYTSALLPALKSLGYEGSYMKRTWTEINEGEATFVKTSRFTVESAKGLSLSELAKKNMSESGLAPEVQTAIDEYLNRADVVNISRLRCKRTDKVLTLGNIHVVWDHLRSPDIQSIQIAVAVKELVHQAGSDSSPHILCGDFNSAPSSVGYQLAKDGYLSDANIATLQAVENLKLNTGSKALVNHLWGAFQHTSSNLSSAYKTCQDSEPDVTTFTCEMFSCVDYLFYGSVGLEVKDVLRTVDKHVVEETTGLPAEKIPSDHLSLKANFFFR